jgi:hypothetical protein
VLHTVPENALIGTSAKRNGILIAVVHDLSIQLSIDSGFDRPPVSTAPHHRLNTQTASSVGEAASEDTRIVTQADFPTGNMGKKRPEILGCTGRGGGI